MSAHPLVEDEDQKPPRPCATPPPHAYRAGIIGTGIAAIGDDEIININARILKIEDRDSFNIVARALDIKDRDSVAIVTVDNSADVKIIARDLGIEDRDSFGVKIIARNLDIEDRDCVGIVIVGNLAIHDITDPQTDVVTTDDLAINTRTQVNIVDDPAIDT